MGRVRKVWILISNYGMFRIGSDGSWLGLSVTGQEIRDINGVGGVAEGAVASIQENNTVKIEGDGYSLVLEFNEGQEVAAQEFVDRFNYFATGTTPSE